MITKVLLPKLGETMEEGAIGKWLVKEGDKVNKGDVLFEITTDKANFEYEALKGGYIRKILYKEGIVVPVLVPVAYTADSMSEPLPKEEPLPPAKPKEEQISSPAPVSAPISAPVVEPVFIPAPVVQAIFTADGRIFATPIAKRLAKEKGLDLLNIAGSGPNGRILERDILNYKPGTMKAAPAVTAAASLNMAKLKSNGGSKTSDLSQMRKIIADRLKKSKQEAPHFYLQLDVDMTELLKKRAELTAKGVAVSVNDFVIFASAVALREFPLMNSHFVNEKVVQFEDANVGVAVALENGLVVPVIKQANNKTVRAIAAEAKILAEKAKTGKLTAEDYSGGTFTISNMGMLGVDNFSAIINPPQVGILAVSAAKKQTVVINDAIAIRSIMKVTLSADHRVIDGAYAAKFLTRVKEVLEKYLFNI